MNDDGTMARLPQLAEFCRVHDLKLLTIADLIRYRMRHERYVRRIAESVLPTRYGDFRMIVYSSELEWRPAHRARFAACPRARDSPRMWRLPAQSDNPERRAAAGPRPRALPHRRCSRLIRVRLLRVGAPFARSHRRRWPRRFRLSPRGRAQLRHRARRHCPANCRAFYFIRAISPRNRLARKMARNVSKDCNTRAESARRF